MDEAPLRAAVESIPGLRGFVGVDFIWDEGRRRATVLEINPRPTTSIVGLTRILPPGRLASAWIGAFDPDYPARHLLPGLADLVPCAPSGDLRCIRSESAPRRRRMSRLYWDSTGPPGSAWISAGPTSRPRTVEGPRSAVPFEVWKRPDELSRRSHRSRDVAAQLECVAVTMTAELCDCYPTKTVGVHAVLDAVLAALPDASDRRLGGGRPVPRRRGRAGAADARGGGQLAGPGELAARLVPDDPAILIDIGTTTTDLIPLDRGAVAARGRSDTERLQTGELVYAGVRRTPVHALATELPFRGVPTGLAAELFASTLDVYLDPGRHRVQPARPLDGRRPTRDRRGGPRSPGPDDRRRPRRLLRADAPAHSPGPPILPDWIGWMRAAERACRATIGRPGAAVIAGSGDFLARRLARRLVGRDAARHQPERGLGTGRLGRRLCSTRSSSSRPNVSKWRIGWLDLPALPSFWSEDSS